MTSSDRAPTVEVISETVEHSVAAIDSLKDALARVGSSMALVEARRRAEARVEELLEGAEHFVDAAVAKAVADARRTVSDAESEARRIVAEARHKAERLVDEAKSAPAASSEVLHRLDSTIQQFHRANGVLARELVLLEQSMADLRPGAPEAGSPTRASGPPAIAVEAGTAPEPDMASVAADLTGAWMTDERPFWDEGPEYQDPPRRFWRRSE